MAVFRFLVLFFALSSGLAQAGDIPDGASLVQLNTHIFDLRSDVRKLRRNGDFIPLNTIEWLRKLIEEDEYLGLAVVHIQTRPQPVLEHWYSLEPDRRYPLTDNIPGMFVLDGYQTRSSDPSNRTLLLVPRDDPNDFHVRCGGGKIEKDRFCAVHATYPPDPNISLLARVYHAKPPFHFREIVHRIREIAHCLDVTEAVNNGTYRPAPYVDPDGDLPELRNCHEPAS